MEHLPFNERLKYFAIIATLYFYIDFTYFVNTFIWDKMIASMSAGGSQAISIFAIPLPISLVFLSTAIFVILFFSICFYYFQDLNIDTANYILIFSAFLFGVRKVYCLKCMLMGTFATVVFFVPALLSMKVAYFLVKYIKRKSSLLY